MADEGVIMSAKTVSVAAPPLRVALFAGNYNYVVDGPVKALNTLVAHLLKRGHKVLVFAPTIPNPPYQATGDVVSIPSVPLPGRRSEYRLGLGLFGEARRRLEAFRPDLIHVAAPDVTGYMALKYAEKRGVTLVGSFHTRFDTYPRYYGAAWAEGYVTAYLRNFYGRCRHVYAPSLSMVEELERDRIGSDVRLWGRGVDKTLYHPGRRDLSWRRANGFADDDIVTLFVGRIVLEKGIDLFAEAVRAAAARNPKIKALVVGEGPERPAFAERFTNAVFTGYQSGEDLARCYASADIFLNPSVTETFGNVTLEAMASGLPSICAAASGSRSLVEDGVSGYLTPPERGAAGFAEALFKLADEAEMRRDFAAAAIARAYGFDWDHVLDGLIDNYRQAISAAAAHH